MQTDLTDWVYLLGKLDALRHPLCSVNYDGVKALLYPADYIEELLRLRAQLMKLRARAATIT